MKNLFKLLFLVFLYTSCGTTKTQTGTTKTQTYFWKGKEVSKRKYDLLLRKFTINFIKNYPKEELKKFVNFEVVYDTIVK
jgi:hypothetical protein